MDETLAIAIAQKRVDKRVAEVAADLSGALTEKAQRDLEALDAHAEQQALALDEQVRSSVPLEVKAQLAEQVEALAIPERITRGIPPEVEAYIKANPPAAGVDGEPGLGINWRGPWNPRLTYAIQDACESKGSSYIATTPIPKGMAPPAKGWDLMAQRGDPGRTAFGRSGGSGGGGGTANLSNDIPLVEFATGSAGVGTEASRDDHVHPAFGGGGTFPDYLQPDDPGAVGAGRTWVQTPPDVNPDPWSAENPYPINHWVQPDPANGHYYGAVNGGTSDVAPPVWPTDGSSVMDNDIEWLDLGLLGPVDGVTLPLRVRNATDDAWLNVGMASRYAVADEDAAATSTVVRYFDDQGVARTGLDLGETFAQFFVDSPEGGLVSQVDLDTARAAINFGNNGTVVSGVEFNATGMELTIASDTGDLDDVLTAQGDGTAIWAPASGGGLTPGTYTITNDSTLRTIDVATATPTQMLNFMATVVRDLGGV